MSSTAKSNCAKIVIAPNCRPVRQRAVRLPRFRCAGCGADRLGLISAWSSAAELPVNRCPGQVCAFLNTALQTGVLQQLHWDNTRTDDKVLAHPVFQGWRGPANAAPG